MNNEEKKKFVDICRKVKDKELFNMYLDECSKKALDYQERKDIIYDVLLERGLIM